MCYDINESVAALAGLTIERADVVERVVTNSEGVHTALDTLICHFDPDETGRFAQVPAFQGIVQFVVGDLLQVLLSPTPEKSFPPAPRWLPRAKPTQTELLTGASV